MCRDNRDLAVNGVDTLNDIHGDLITGTMVFRHYDHQHRAGKVVTREMMIDVQRMCVSHLVLSLNKFLEFRKKFSALITHEYSSDVRQLTKRLEQKRLRDFRNKCVGHIWDTDKDRPLKNSEVMEKLDNITGGKMIDFIRWINDPEANIYPKTVVSVVERLRDDIAAVHCIDPREILER